MGESGAISGMALGEGDGVVHGLTNERHVLGGIKVLVRSPVKLTPKPARGVVVQP